MRALLATSQKLIKGRSGSVSTQLYSAQLVIWRQITLPTSLVLIRARSCRIDNIDKISSLVSAVTLPR